MLLRLSSEKLLPIEPELRSEKPTSLIAKLKSEFPEGVSEAGPPPNPPGLFLAKLGVNTEVRDSFY